MAQETEAKDDRKAFRSTSGSPATSSTGSKEGLTRISNEAAGHDGPLDIINGPLMAGMDEVGRLFDDNELIVAEVLQSAEAMKAAVAHLEPHMEKTESSISGKILLATVKGDVHDIGKNLVEIILSNNGYRVDQPRHQGAARRSHPRDRGAQARRDRALWAAGEERAADGHHGAGPEERRNRLPDAGGRRRALEPLHTDQDRARDPGLVAYANDAMSGLALANQIMDYERRETLKLRLDEDSAKMIASAPKPVTAAPTAIAAKSSVRRDIEIPTPPDLKTHVLREYDLTEISRYINPAMLYSKDLGLHNAENALRSGDPKALKLRAEVEAVQDVMASRSDITANAIFRFFRAESDGDRTVRLLNANATSVLATFRFGRQVQPPHLCLADYIGDARSGRPDYLCLFIVTIGQGVRALGEEWKNRGDYLRSHILLALANQGVEAFAELLHQKIRAMWGIGDPVGISMKDLFQSRYHGKRYSFGYGACPRLEDQTQLFELLEPARHGIAVNLTEEFMMDPESSVSALVFHHPECKYFNLSPDDAERLEAEFAAPSA